VRTLPANKNPTGTRCIQITIPDDDDWERALYSEVTELTRWMRWERDLGKNGKPVADIWLKALQTWKYCDGSPSPIHGMEVDLDMSGLRIDCDCNVFITCCDGTEKQLLTKDQVEALLGMGSNVDAPPAPPGECADYNATLQGSEAWPIPVPLSSGDTVSVTGFDGATLESGQILWRGPQGKTFFNRAYLNGTEYTDPGDLVPTAPHQSLVLSINGAYYSLIGGTFTVPGGISNAQGSVVLNVSSPGSISGSVRFKATVCNNQPLTWSHTFDFTINSFGDLFTFPTHDYLSGPLGYYQPGVGITGDFQTDIDGKSYNGLYIALDRVINYTEVRADFTYTAGTYASIYPNYSFEYNYFPGPTSHNQVTLPTTPTSPQIDPIPISSTNLEVQILTGMRDDGTDPGGNCVLTSLRISGTGTDPFST
jgi:hypothetical protein